MPDEEMSEILEKFRSAATRYSEVLAKLRRHEIPESYIEFCDSPLSPTQLDFGSEFLRDTFLELSGYCLVAYDWVRPLAEWIGKRKCLEVMCGCGCLAKALRDCGVDIIATDDFSWENHNACWFQNPWTEIEQLSAVDAVRKYGPQSSLIILSWPYMDDSALNVLREMRVQMPGGMMIMIGEWKGATANGDFFREARLVKDEKFNVAVQNFRQHATIHDFPYLIR